MNTIMMKLGKQSLMRNFVNSLEKSNSTVSIWLLLSLLVGRPWIVIISWYSQDRFSLTITLHQTEVKDTGRQGTFTPPDTWSFPTLGLANVLMLRPYLLHLSCFRTFEFRTSLGTSVFAWRLALSPFLNIGERLADFQSAGVWPWLIGAWKILVSAGVTGWAISFMSTMGISSGPVVLFMLRPCKVSVPPFKWIWCMVQLWWYWCIDLGCQMYLLWWTPMKTVGLGGRLKFGGPHAVFYRRVVEQSQHCHTSCS